jgi:nucleotide-binding universal stress UspA family protein
MFLQKRIGNRIAPSFGDKRPTMIPPKMVLFPVDFSKRSRGAAHAVRALAHRFKAEVMALHVVDRDSPENVSVDRMEEARYGMEEFIRCELAGCTVRPCVTAGDPAMRIVEHARSGRFDLIMIPTHGSAIFVDFCSVL